MRGKQSMPAERISMRKIREVLRLKYEMGLSERVIALSCQLSKTSISRYLARAKQLDLVWPLPDTLDDKALECLLYPSEIKYTYTAPDWRWVHQELKKKGVTLELLWNEYHALEPRGISYSRFCQRYRDFKQTLEPVMRQTHKAGEKLYVVPERKPTQCPNSPGFVIFFLCEDFSKNTRFGYFLAKIA